MRTSVILMAALLSAPAARIVMPAGGRHASPTLRAQHAPARDGAAPSQVAQAALDAMGGDRVRGARSLRVAGIEHVFVLGNAERAEGPWRVLYNRFTELRDLTTDRSRRTDVLIAGRFGRDARVTVVTDSVASTGDAKGVTGASPSVLESALDRVASSPERALVLAAASPALRIDGTVMRWGIPHDVLSFPLRNGRMRIEVNRETHLPTAVDIVRTYPDDFRRGPFGDITLRTEYVDWTVDSTGIWWPRQHIVSLDGEPFRNVTIDSVSISRDPAPADSFVVGDSARAAYATNSRQTVRTFRLGDRGAPVEIRPGIVRVPDLWSMTLVRQDDGIVIFEAHLSATYLHQVIDEAKRRFPGLPIKGIVLTSDPWAHVGGVREAIAMGIPIYVNARSVPFFTALAHAPHTLDPDALQRAPRAPRFVPIAGKTVLGSGVNRIELYPVGGPYAERMTMAYFPALRLLYGADLVFKAAEGGYDPTPATDLRRAVARERLAVDTVFCVQRITPPIPWSEFDPAGAAAAGGS